MSSALGIVQASGLMMNGGPSRGPASQTFPSSSPGPSGAPPDSEMPGVQPWLVKYTSYPAQPGLLLKQVLYAPNYAQVGEPQ